MTHQLLLEVPEDVYASLLETAREEGQSPEAIAVLRLTDALRSNELDPPDPFAKWIGALDVDLPPGWSDDHDRYIGEAIYAHMHNSEPQNNS